MENSLIEIAANLPRIKSFKSPVGVVLVKGLLDWMTSIWGAFKTSSSMSSRPVRKALFQSTFPMCTSSSAKE